MQYHCPMYQSLQGMYSLSRFKFNFNSGETIQIALLFHFFHTLRHPRRQYKVTVFVIWVIALTVNLPWLYVFQLEPIKLGSNRKVSHKKSITINVLSVFLRAFFSPFLSIGFYQVCTELWPSTFSENVYFVLANLLLCYLAPLSVITFCYIIIWRSVANRSIPGEFLGYKSTRDTINKRLANANRDINLKNTIRK